MAANRQSAGMPGSGSGSVSFRPNPVRSVRLGRLTCSFMKGLAEWETTRAERQSSVVAPQVAGRSAAYRAEWNLAPCSLARNDKKPTLRCPVVSLGVGSAGPFFRLPQRGMERREAPGRCATAPLWGAGALLRTPQRALQGQVCESRPEARAGDDLEACEASPSNRCASRRSTGRKRIAPLRPRCAGLISGPASRPARQSVAS